MVRPIVKDIKALRKPSEPILPNEDYSTILQDLKDTLATVNGYALAAVQIGIYKKLAYIKANKDHPEIILINPRIIDKKQKFIFPESCLSFPGLILNCDRYALITIENNGKPEFYMDLVAVICQHEIDHCNGIDLFLKKHKAK